MKGLIIRIVIILLAGGGFWYWYNSINTNEVNPDYVVVVPEKENFGKKLEKKDNKDNDVKAKNNKKNEKENKDDETISKKEIINLQENIDNDVPFIVQAPEGQWTDKRFQDACEEASILMAYRWREDKGGLSKKDATRKFENMFMTEEKFFGKGVYDTSIEDTAHFAREYFGGEFEVRNVTMSSIYKALMDDYIIIVPTNGKMLDNPNFTNGGPERHMLIIKGYDKDDKEFITNDPGTKKGKNYRYPRSRLFNAVRNYKTGHKEPIKAVDKKMIVVKK